MSLQELNCVQRQSQVSGRWTAFESSREFEDLAPQIGLEPLYAQESAGFGLMDVELQPA